MPLVARRREKISIPSITVGARKKSELRRRATTPLPSPDSNGGMLMNSRSQIGVRYFFSRSAGSDQEAGVEFAADEIGWDRIFRCSGMEV